MYFTSWNQNHQAAYAVPVVCIPNVFLDVYIMNLQNSPTWADAI